MATRAMAIDPRQLAPSAPDQPIDPIGTDIVDGNAIAVRAYELWQERGCPIGSDQEDWFQAERELKNAHLTANRRACGIRDARICQGALYIPLRKGERGGKSARQGREAEQSLIVMVHIVSEAGVAVRVEANHTVKGDGRGIRKNDSVPHHLNAILSV